MNVSVEYLSYTELPYSYITSFIITDCSKTVGFYSQDLFCLFVFGATAPSGPWSPHSRDL